MAVVVETTLGDITIDLYTKERPRACLNFLKLCKMKYYNYNLFHTVGRDFIAQTGDPTGSRKGGESVFGVLEGSLKRYFEAETHPRIKHTITGLVSFVGAEDNMIGSQFFITLAPDLTYLDDRHCVFGEVAEGLDVLEILNDAICDTDNRPYQDIRITHTVVLDDPYPDLPKLHIPSRSPSPSAERLQGGRIAPDEEIDETTGKDMQEIEEIKAEREAKARATILEMVGDIPDAEMAPPENVLFVCKLNPVTTDDDLEIIFSRFGKINSCEVIRDRKTGDSLQYAFIEFDESKACEDAYFKMDNVLIDDRRIHVDFSQSVAKVKWLGKGRGVAHFDDKGRRTDDRKNDIGQGNYKGLKRIKEENREKRPTRERPSNDKDRDYEAASRDKERSRRDRQRSSNDRDSPTNQQKSFRDRERSPSDTESPKKQQKFLRERQRSSRDRESPREQQKSLRDRERSPKDRDSPRNPRKYSRDGDSPPRDQQRYSRGQQKSSRAPQGYSRDRQSRDHESSNRYRSPPRSSRRGGYYPEERRERGQYRPYPMQNRRPDRSYNYEEKRKSDYHSARSYEQPRSETSREEYRRPNERRDRAEGSQFKKYSKQQEYSSSEEESSKKILKSKACAKKKSRKTSSSSSSSEDDRKKSQGKSRRQKKKSESDDSSDSSSDSYKKETKRVSKKKKSKYSD